jgi:Holliday junction resolvase-like predicted endonuclease
LTAATVGDIGELRVAADLLARGYDVFKAVCRNCWTDLIVRIDGKLLSVEVKTGHRTPSGKLRYPKPQAGSDVIAVVLPNEIIYLPDVV